MKPHPSPPDFGKTGCGSRIALVVTDDQLDLTAVDPASVIDSFLPVFIALLDILCGGRKLPVKEITAPILMGPVALADPLLPLPQPAVRSTTANSAAPKSCTRLMPDPLVRVLWIDRCSWLGHTGGSSFGRRGTQVHISDSTIVGQLLGLLS
jgi:hypothetical protein